MIKTYFEIEAFSSCHGLENLGGDCASHHINLRGIFVTVMLTIAKPGPPAQKSTQFITTKYMPITIPATIEIKTVNSVVQITNTESYILHFIFNTHKFYQHSVNSICGDQ
jgi:hypothetical protein